MTEQFDTSLLTDRNMRASASDWPRVELTARQKRQWVETRSALLWATPAFSYIYYTMMQRGLPEGAVFTSEVPIAATDGRHILINPEKFFEFPLAKRVFIVAHEIVHAIFDHCSLFYNAKLRGYVIAPDGRRLPHHQMLLNIAADLVINDLLIECKVGEYDKGWLHDPTKGTHMDGVPKVYAKLFDEAKKQGKLGGNPQPGDGGNEYGGKVGFDEHLEPGQAQGQDPAKASAERSQAEWDTAIAAANASAKLQGKLPAALERLFSDHLTPQVDWREHIRALFARRIGYGSTSWRRPNRQLIVRDIYAPGRTGHAAGLIALAIDTSGSIGQKEIDFFIAELRGIIDDLNPERVLVIWCDSKVHSVQEVTDTGDISTLKAQGGGGTDFRPVFHYMDKHGYEPDALVYLTDLEGSFPDKAPTYPVIWGRTTKHAVPFGDVVEVPIKA